MGTLRTDDHLPPGVLPQSAHADRNGPAWLTLNSDPNAMIFEGCDRGLVS